MRAKIQIKPLDDGRPVLGNHPMPSPKPIASVYTVSTDLGKKCPVCSEFLQGHKDFSGAVNHVIGHGWTVEHIGSETAHGDAGLWHSTVAVLAART
jgi:hypothetical protein